jgi:glycosyltransferase involved in cell wall biosynthesis
LFGRFDVGIMPLPDDPYTRYKAGFKLLQYMTAGSAVVASPVGANVDLVTESEAGLLASSADEWYEALHELATDPVARAQYGENGVRFMRTFADLDHQADVLARLLIGAPESKSG